MSRLWLLLLLTCCVLHVGYAQPTKAQPVFRIDSLPAQGILLDKGWKWHTGDNPDWAKPEFDDSKWESIDPTSPFSKLPQVTEAEIGWFRIAVTIDSSLVNQPLIVTTNTPPKGLMMGALEIYLDGKLIGSIGKVSKDPGIEKTFAGTDKVFPIFFSHSQTHIIAIHYSLTKSNDYFQERNPFYVSIRRLDGWGKEVRQYLSNFTFATFGAGVFVIMALLHLFFYFFYPAQRSNLLFSIALTFGVIQGLTHYFVSTIPFSVSVFYSLIAINRIFSLPFYLILLFAVYEYLQQSRKRMFWGLVMVNLFYLVTLFLTAFNFDFNLNIYTIILLITLLDYLYVSYQSMRDGNQNGRIIFYGGMFFFILFLANLFIVKYAELDHYNLPLTASQIIWLLIFFSMPVSFSLAMARDFAQTNTSLKKNLEEIKQLSTEKQQILSTQNELLEQQVEQRTAELRASQAQLIQREKLASLGELTAGIAHEIQNPLNFVNNFSEVSTELVTELEDEQQKPERDTELEAELLSDLKQNLQKITHHGGRASAIVKGMLEHSRSSIGERQPTNLNALTDEYLRLAYQGLRAKNKDFNCQLVTDFDPDLGRVEVMPQEIGRVLLNLYNNAFYAVQQKQKLAPADYQPTVTVSSRRSESSIEIRVRDNGTGIPDAVKAKIFQPFFTTKPTGEGTGLGLSLSYDIITKGHGGTLTVESVVGEGTTFIITLPIS